MKNLILLMLFAIANFAMAQTVPLNEDFEGSTLSFNSSGSPGWSLSTQLFNGGSKSDSASIVLPGDSSVLMSDAFSTLTNTHVILEFDHICKIEYFDAAQIFVSADNGVTWTLLTENHYQGNGNFSNATGNKFTSSAYSTWQFGVTTTPTNTWWKHETFDISAIAGNASSVKIRFDLVDKNNTTLFDNYAWFIDDIKVTTALTEYDPPQITLPSSNPSGAKYGLNVPYIEANIVEASGLDTVMLIYTEDGGTADTVNMMHMGGNTYGAYIDTVGNPIEVGDTFCYYVYAVDASAFHLSDVKPATGCNQFYIQSLPNPTCSVTKSVFPYTQNFSSFSSGGTYCAPIPKTLGQGWVNSTGDNNEWIPNNIMYVNAVGPVYDHTSNSYNGSMLTLRTCTNKNAKLITPCFDIRNLNYPSVEFWYFMNGTGVGTLKLEILYGGVWTEIWSKSGSQNSSWNKAKVNLSNYKHIVKMRITGTTLSSSQISVSLDDFTVKEGVVNDMGISAIESPQNGTSTPTDSIIARLKNYADNHIQNPQIVYAVNGVVQDTVVWNHTLTSGTDTAIFLGTYTFSSGTNVIKAWTMKPNGLTDTDASNDTSSYNLIVCGGALAGNYTIDATQAPSATNYLSIQDAVISLKSCGISGPTTFKIANGTYTVSDLVIDSLLGTNATNVLTFESVSGDPDDVTIQAATTGVYAFKLVNARNLHFKNLTFKAAQSGTFGRLFAINTDNENIHFVGNNFIGRSISSTSQNYAHIIIWATSRGKDIVFEDNYFFKGSFAINMKANAANHTQSLFIKNNSFNAVYHQALLLPYTDSLLVEGNLFYGNSATATTSYRIYTKYCTNFIIQNNDVRGKNTCIYVENSNATSAKPSIVANNFVYTNGTSANARGIRVKNSANVHFYYNSLNSVNTSASNVLFYFEGTGTNQFYNNVVHQQANGYAVQLTSTANNMLSDYNLLYSAGAKVAKKGTATYTDLAAWNTATSLDANSVSAPMSFVSNTNLHTVDLDVFQKGNPLTAITVDYDGEARDATSPCIGADEFILFAKDLGVTQILRPVAIDSATKVVAVQSKVKNFGIDTIFSFDVSYSVDGATAVVTTINDTLIANQSKTFNLTNLTIPFGNHSLEVFTTFSNDGDLTNDTTTLAFEGLSADDVELTQVYTLGNLPKNCGVPHQVSALVENKSYQKLLNVPVYLEVTGVNSWSDTAYIDTLEVGVSEYVVFDDYTPSVLGNDTIKVNLGSDDNTSDNNLYKLQEVTEDEFSFSYGNSADTNITVNQQALFSKFNVKGAKIVDEIRVYISADATVGDTIYTLALDSSKNVLAISDSLIISASDIDSYVTFDLYDSTAVLVNTNFYIGVAALGNASHLVGIQNVDPVHQNTFFTSNNLSITTLTDIASSIQGLPMMEVSMVNPPAFDVSITNFLSPLDACGLASENVTIEIQNNGLDTLIGNLPVSYEMMGGTIVTETVAVNILPSAVQQYTFTSHADLSVSTDSVFQLRAWTYLLEDANHNNDTSAWHQVVSTYKPLLPVVTNDTINYGDTAFLSATSTDGYALNWYDSNVNGTLINSGTSYTNGVPTFDTVSYYVEALNSGPAHLVISEFVTNTNGTGVATSMPSYVHPIVGSTNYVEIANNGGQTADLSNYTFNFYNPSGNAKVESYTFASGIQLAAGDVMLLDVQSTGIDKPANNYYTLNIQGNLWSAHSQAIYLNDASGNLVDALVMGTNLFTDSTGITANDWAGTITPTGGLAGLIRADLDSNKASDWIWSSATDVMNTGLMNTPLLNAQSTGCASAKAEVKVIVQNIPQSETALLQITSPVNTMNTQVSNSIDVDIENNGLVPLTSLNIQWSMNGGTPTTYAWTGSLAVNATTNINIGTYTPQGGLYDLKVWTSLPNNIADVYPHNDTLNTTLESTLMGTYTIGDTTGGLSFDFVSIENAVNVLNQVGISGAVTFDIAGGTYTASELELSTVTGMSATNTVTFKSATNNANSVTIQTSDDFAIQLDDVHHIFFKYISFTTNSTGSYKRILVLKNDNTIDIRNCSFTGVSTYIGTSTRALIYAYNTGMDSLIIDSCDFKYGGYGIYMLGSSSNTHKAIEVTNSTFTDIASWGLYVSRSNSVLATNNIFDGDNTYSDGIYVAYCPDLNITNNRMSDMDNGLYLSSSIGTASQPLLVANNMIQGKNNGIKINSGVKYGHIIHNTVNITGTSTSSSSGNALYLTTSSSDSTKIYNNIFIQSGIGRVMYMSGSFNPIVKLDYNNYYSSGSSFMRINNVNYSDYAAYKMVYPLDANSDSIDVIFSSTTDQHCIDPRMDGAGTPAFSIATDIDGDLRDVTNPDMGADEFDTYAVDMKSVSFSSLKPMQAENSNYFLSVNVMNQGKDSVLSLPISYEYMGSTVSETLSLTLAPMQHYKHTFSTPLSVELNSNPLKVYTHISADADLTNDTLSTPIIGVTVTRPAYTTDFENQNSFVNLDNSSVWEIGLPNATQIDTAYSGIKACVTNLNGIVSQTGIFHTYSPMFEVSNVVDTMVLSFMKNHQLSGGDYVQIQMRNGNNGVWNNVGYDGDPAGSNWYNDHNAGIHYWSGTTNGWEMSEYRLGTNSFSALDTIQFRFSLTNTTGTNEGFAIDSFSFQYEQDCGIDSIYYNAMDTAAGSQVYAMVRIQNYGTDSIINTPVSLTINGVPSVVNTANVNLARGESIDYTFTTAYTVPSSNYLLCASTQLIGDGDSYNDTHCDSLKSITLAPDVAVSAIVQPDTNNSNICIGQGYYNYDVEVELKNAGQTTITSLLLEYRVNTIYVVQETWTGTLLPNQTTTYTFQQKWAPIHLGNLELCLKATLNGDVDLNNNRLCKTYIGDACTGIEQVNDDAFRVSQNRPNPTSGLTVIDVYVPRSDKVIVNIYNQMGQMMTNQELSLSSGKQSIELNLHSLADGIYYYKVQYKDKVYTHKLVINK